MGHKIGLRGDSMQIDKNQFFREATLRICGSLDTETSLHKCYEYIRTYIPSDLMVLCHYYPDAQKHVVLAVAMQGGGLLLNHTTAETPDSHQHIISNRESDSDIEIVDGIANYPPARAWVSMGFIPEESSLLTLRLNLGETVVGAVNVFSQGHNRFTQDHADLLSLLKEPFAIALSNGIRYQELLELKERLAEDNQFLQNELRLASGDEIVGVDFGLRGVMEMVRQVAPLSSPVLLLGETGTGKEIIASAIHNLSSRANDSFIKVNCGAIPESLVDSELFGHEKGAFTGASFLKRGRFERANGGTLFLDEVGEFQPEAQVRLLRALQEKEIERVGGIDPIRVDIRVIAATHRDLPSQIKAGKFREDLYYRLKVFPIVIPPLRDRRLDIPSLTQHFIQKKSLEMGLKVLPSLAPGALETLMAHSWPGNVRELENAVERALILSKGLPLVFPDLIDFSSSPFQTDSVPAPRTSAEVPHKDERLHGKDLPQDILPLDEIMSAHIRRAMEATSGRIGGAAGAAVLLQINSATLRKRMRKLGIPFGKKKMAK